MVCTKFNSWLWLAAGACVSPFVAIAPLQAATFSWVSSALHLDNFSQFPVEKQSLLSTDAAALSGTDDAIALTDFDGVLDFVADSEATRLAGQFQAVSQGQGPRYLGRAEVESEALARFNVEAKTPFRFEFATSLRFNTVTDGTPFESASAFTDISLQLLGPQDTVLSFFELTAEMNTHSMEAMPNDFLDVSTNASLTNASSQAALGQKQETAAVWYAGVFEQTFDTPTQIKLVAQTRSQACVQAPGAAQACVKVPEPSNRLALVLAAVVLGTLTWCQKRFG